MQYQQEKRYQITDINIYKYECDMRAKYTKKGADLVMGSNMIY